MNRIPLARFFVLRFTCRFMLLLVLGAGLSVSAPAQSPERLPSWAAPSEARPAEGSLGSTSSALGAGDIDPFPDDPVQVPMQGLVLLALAGAAYGARRLRVRAA